MIHFPENRNSIVPERDSLICGMQDERGMDGYDIRCRAAMFLNCKTGDSVILWLYKRKSCRSDTVIYEWGAGYGYTKENLVGGMTGGRAKEWY